MDMKNKRVSFSNQTNIAKVKSLTDVETEQEAIELIKFQNKKIQDLTDELDKRDKRIQALQTQLTSMDNYKFQMENFKRQTTVLEDKLKLYESDITSKAFQLTEQLNLISDSEAKLRNQVMSKDKVIMDLNNKIQEYDSNVNALIKQNMEKEQINNQLRQEINEVSSKFRNLTKRLEGKESDVKKLLDDRDNDYHELANEKQHLEDKLTQIIDIIKQYSKELSDLNYKIKQGEADYKYYIS
jgi:chromosome segregation ATPase